METNRCILLSKRPILVYPPPAVRSSSNAHFVVGYCYPYPKKHSIDVKAMQTQGERAKRRSKEVKLGKIRQLERTGRRRSS